MKVFLALALVTLMALPGCIYSGGGYGRGYYADHHDHHHRAHRDSRGRW
jgi:hypothetical protein